MAPTIFRFSWNLPALASDTSSKLKRPLIIVCDWIPPAFGAVGQYQLAKAREAAAEGRPTTIIGLGNAASDTVEPVESNDGAPTSLRIIRLAAKPAHKRGALQRGLWSLEMNFRLIGATLRTLKRGDNAQLKVTGSPPFLAYLMIITNGIFLRRPLTYRMTDFYPETAIAAGKGGALKLALPLFHWLRRMASDIEVLSECQERRLTESGIPTARIRIERDGSPVDFSTPLSPPPRPFAEDKAILLYSGNFGIAHDVDTIAEAYRRHVQDGPDRVRLWLNATGAKVERLARYCKDNNLPIHITQPVPLDQLAGLLCSVDAHLVTLDRPFWGYVIPSKIYACIGSGKPVLYIGPDESDVHRLTASDPKNASVRNGNVDACLAALDRLGAQETQAPRAQVRMPTSELAK